MPTLEVVNATDLVHNTLFLSVNFGSFGNSRKVEEDVLTTDAAHSCIKVSKTLLDSEELKAIVKADSKLRVWLKEVCHPFEKGISLVPYGLVEAVTNKLKEHKLERAGLVSAFAVVYPRLREEARTTLGSLYHSGDYPEPQDVANVFSFDWRLSSIGAPNELKTISERLFLEEKDRQAEQFRIASETITKAMRQALFEMVSNLQERLSPTEDGKKRIIRQDGLNKMQGFFDIFALKDVTNDTQLGALVQQAKELLDGTSADMLRSNEELAERVRAGMENITNSLSALIEEEPDRMFREEDE